MRDAGNIDQLNSPAILTASPPEPFRVLNCE